MTLGKKAVQLVREPMHVPGDNLEERHVLLVVRWSASSAGRKVCICEHSNRHGQRRWLWIKLFLDVFPDAVLSFLPRPGI